MTFHVVSVFDEAGLTRRLAVAIFLPMSVVSILVRLGAGVLSDRAKLKYLLIGQLSGLLVLSVSILSLPRTLGLAGVVLGNGIVLGLLPMLPNITWARYFGKSHLGAIAGFAVSLMVTGSAIGPSVFGLSFSVTGSYDVASISCAVAAALLCFAAIKAEPRDVIAAAVR